MSFFKGSMELPDGGKDILPEEEDKVLDKLAKMVIKRGMAIPAIMFLESIKPLNYISSQVMVFFEPLVQTIFSFKDYDTFRTALEKRETIEILILRIEEYDAIDHRREKRIKKFLKEEKKKWKWYQRYLGVFTPKVVYPPEVLNDPEPSADKLPDQSNDDKSES